MPEWWTYRPSDFLLFSPRAYYRMFELYHQQLWPAQFVGGAGAIAILASLGGTNERRGRVVAALLAAGWLWVAIAFHFQRYATINWGARYFALLFVVQSLLLIWIGVVRERLTFPAPQQLGRRLVIAMFIVAIVCAPLVSSISGRSWQQLEFFGITPDATAVATIALVVLASPPTPRALLAAPILWCVISGGTLWALGSPEAIFVLLSALAGLIGVIRPRLARDRSAGPDHAF